MLATLRVEEFALACSIGVWPHEKEQLQTLLIDLELVVDISKCIVSDSIEDTVDYEEVIEVCEKVATSQHFHLLEVLGFQILESILMQFPLERAHVRLRKKEAIVNASCATFELDLFKDQILKMKQKQLTNVN